MDTLSCSFDQSLVALHILWMRECYVHSVPEQSVVLEVATRCVDLFRLHYQRELQVGITNEKIWSGHIVGFVRHWELNNLEMVQQIHALCHLSYLKMLIFETVAQIRNGPMMLFHPIRM